MTHELSDIASIDSIRLETIASFVCSLANPHAAPATAAIISYIAPPCL